MTYNILTNIVFTGIIGALLFAFTKFQAAARQRNLRSSHKRVMRSHQSADRIVHYRGLDNLNR